MAGISLTLAQSFLSLPLPPAGLLLHVLLGPAGEAGRQAAGEAATGQSC